MVGNVFALAVVSLFLAHILLKRDVYTRVTNQQYRESDRYAVIDSAALDSMRAGHEKDQPASSRVRCDPADMLSQNSCSRLANSVKILASMPREWANQTERSKGLRATTLGGDRPANRVCAASDRR